MCELKIEFTIDSKDLGKLAESMNFTVRDFAWHKIAPKDHPRNRGGLKEVIFNVLSKNETAKISEIRNAIVASGYSMKSGHSQIHQLKKAKIIRGLGGGVYQLNKTLKPKLLTHETSK